MRWLLAQILLSLATLTTLIGCQATEQTDDVLQAATKVEQHSGRKPSWATPQSEDASVWDKQSPLAADQAITLALQSNPQVRADVEAIRSLSADLVQAGLLPNPILSLAFQFPEGGLGSPLFTFGFVQQIAPLWLMPSRKEAAHAALQTQILQTSANALELTAKVQKSHARMVHSQQSLKLIDQNAEVLKQAMELAQSKIDVGTATQLDINRVQADLYHNQAQLESMQSKLDHEKRDMLELVGLAHVFADWVAQEPTEVMQLSVDEQQLVELAQTHRLDVLAVEWSIKSKTQHLRQEQLKTFPSMKLGIDAERDAVSQGSPSSEAAYATGPSISLDVPIFDQNQAQIAKAQAELAIEVVRLQAKQQQAIREVRQAYVSYQEATRLVTFFESQIVPLQEENLQLAEAAFKSGEGDMVSLINAQRELIASKLSLVGHKRDVMIAFADLQRTVGGSLILSDTEK